MAFVGDEHIGEGDGRVTMLGAHLAATHKFARHSAVVSTKEDS